jgi:molybdate transport system substrate-binding protein
MYMRAILVALALLLPAELQAAEIKVLTTGIFRGFFPQIISQFESSSGHKVVLITATPFALKDRLLNGEDADVVIAVTPIMKDIEQAGKIIQASRAKLGQTYVAAAVRAGAPRPDLSTPDAVKHAILAAKAVAINDPKGGSNIARFVMGLADRFAFDDELRSRFKLFPGGGDQVAKAVVNGDADFGITISSEILAVKGAEIAGALPPEMQQLIVAYGFLVPGTKQEEAGAAFIKFLLSSDVKTLLKANGIQTD